MASSQVVNDRAMSAGPSTIRASPMSGTGGTTVIQSVRWRAFGAWARALAWLPSAQPKPPASTSRNGSTAAEWDRATPTTPRPTRARANPAAWRRDTRWPRATPMSTVNGADDCSTSEASPAGIPCAMPR